MSSSLYWRQAEPPPPEHELPYQLKALLGRRLWHHDGSLYGDDMEVGKEFVWYLEGLADCGVEGADDLIAAIRTHGSVIVWIGP